MASRSSDPRDPPAAAPRHPGARIGSFAARLVSVTVACWLVGRGVGWSDVANSLRRARLSLLGATVLLNVLMMTVKAIRLRLLLGGRASVATCFAANLSGSALNNLTPFRGGDVARLWMLEVHAGVTKTSAAVIALAEHIFELLALSVLACLAAASIHTQGWAVSSAAALLFAMVIAVLIVGHAGRHPPGSESEAPQGKGRLWRLLHRRVQPAAAVLRSRKTVAAALALSLLSCLIEARMVTLTGDAVGLKTGTALALVVLFGINVAMAVPALPASAGVFEAGATLVLMRAGVVRDRALAFAILYHLVQVVPVTLAGGILILRNGFTLRGLRQGPGGRAVDSLDPVLATRAREEAP